MFSVFRAFLLSDRINDYMSIIWGLKWRLKNLSFSFCTAVKFESYLPNRT